MRAAAARSSTMVTSTSSALRGQLHTKKVSCITRASIAALPGLGFDRGYVPLRQSEPQAEDLFSRHSFHVVRGAIGLIVFPHQQTRRKCAQAPSRLVRQRDIGMLLVVDIERLKKLTKSRHGRVPFHRAPSVGSTESHYPRAPVCMRSVRLPRA